jgi:hypothetical protein
VPKNAFEINRFLQSKGMATLAQAGPLMSQLAYCIPDNAAFKRALMACEPQERRHMYDALKPNLRFKAHPLDTYVIESHQDAEARQLPTIGPDGNFIPFRVPEVQTQPGDAEVQKLVESAVVDSVARHHLRVTCFKCTKEAVFSGITKQDAVVALREAGWRLKYKPDSVELERAEVCPECP